MRSASILVAVVFATMPVAAAAPPAIANGTYHCHTGSGQFVLTLGDAVIAGSRYTVTGPQGHRTGGTYAASRTGYTWSGDFGAVKHDQLADSTPAPGGFDVRYALGHTSPVSITCRR